jgi:hypothetical protein
MLTSLLPCVWLAAASAQAPGIDYLDPADAGPDYPLQGEYAGQARSADGSQSPLAVQVIALGDGSFKAVYLPGGLPGLGWTGAGRVEGDGARSGTGVSFSSQGGYSGTIASGAFQGTLPGGSFALVKRERANPSLGTPPPAGARVLFDGTGTAGWTRARLVSQPSAQGRDALEPTAEPGAATAATFGDFSLHVEFRTPFSPWNRGQNRGNSGIVLSTQAWGELQILDSFGLEPGLQDCGALYEKAVPRVNACLPPLVWQAYEIQYHAPVIQGGRRVKEAMLSAWLNGLPIHADRSVPGMAERGPLILQYHFNPVWFRNAWIVDGRADFPFPTAPIVSLRAPRAPRGRAYSPGALEIASPLQARGAWDAVAASLGWYRPMPGRE